MRSAIRTAPAKVLNRPRIRAKPMCRAVKAIDECAGSSSQWPGCGSSGGSTASRMISAVPGCTESSTIVAPWNGAKPSAVTVSRYSPSGTAAVKPPYGSVSPLTTRRPIGSVTSNFAWRTGWWTVSRTRQLSSRAV